ncbi:replication factor A2 [Nematocida sp. LUAm3]|nr:replication factor A2 [Nematocida sp. LUAm3]KAI5175311.1 replication factor A2 [Nematocida sp. LUAm2]KAI5177732.1 replication factor A2 [Nematocida sp. LUAm1]
MERMESYGALSSKSLMKLTLLQLSEASEKFKEMPVSYVNGLPLNSALAVAWIRSIEETTNSNRYILYDGTAELKCLFGKNQAISSELAIGDLVRVIGYFFKTTGENVSVLFYATKISKVTDGNYLAYHFLSILQQHRQSLSTDTPKENAILMGDETLLDFEIGNIRNRLDFSQDLSPIHYEICDLLRKSQGKDGYAKKHIRHALKDKYDFSEIDGAIKHLLDSGLCFYTSQDDDKIGLVQED